MKSRTILTSLIVVCIVAAAAQACGPEFFPDVFVRSLRPDKPKEYAAGKLGVLLPTYPRADLAVAYRYLNGGTLNGAEQAAYEPTYPMFDPEWEKQWDAQNAAAQAGEDPAAQWKKLRGQYAGLAPVAAAKPADAQPAGYVPETDYSNCNADAFVTAAATLRARAKAWGERSADLADWLRGQDAVFNNCPGAVLTLPGDVPSGASVLLEADRAYQRAAARFYAGNYGDARKGFEAIGQDQSSPWHGIAPYLAARCMVRQAFHDGKSSDTGDAATFNSTEMQQAADLLNSLLKQDVPGAPRQAIANELDLVRIRLEPMVRVREISAAIAGPTADANYTHHLSDLTWFLNLKLDELPVRSDSGGGQNDQPQDFGNAYADLKELRASAPLVDWLITFQSPAPDAGKHAVAEWKQTHQAAWLLAAMTKASGSDAAAADLVAAAAEVKPDAPAWESFEYQRIRLLIAMGRVAEAQTLLANAMPKVKAGGRDSSANLFLALEARTAGSLDQYLGYAPRKTIQAVSESQSSLTECQDVMKDPKRVYDCAHTVAPVQFSTDSANFFNTQAPLAILVEAANSNTLPPQLRTSVATMAWVRAVLLKDDATAQKLQPLLPEKLRQEAAPGSGLHVLMTLLRNPGLRPYLDGGVQRSYSYDFVESYADNWWCQDWQKTWSDGDLPVQPADAATFLSTAQRREADAEVTKLVSEKGAAVYLGGLVIDYANAHPEDQDVPESLYLLLRTIRYGCERGHAQYDNTADVEGRRVDELRKTAARILRQKYTTNAWTKKAAPFVGGTA